MSRRISRRSFIKGVAAASAAAPLIVPNLSFANPPSGKLHHAAIGVMGKGRSDLSEIAGSGKVDVVALCDIDENSLKTAAQAFPKAKLYRDWREMFEKEEGNIDSVDIATPDHTHAPPAMTAIRQGIHVYCEKPLTHEVHEARRLTLAARKKGVASQMGIQIHAHPTYRSAVQLVREGAIGKVVLWNSWSAASYTTEDKMRPVGEDPIPPQVDWDLWLGVAPYRPYKADTYHPFKWRCWRDFGGGATGDFGCHIFDPVFGATGVRAPLTVCSHPECVSDEVWPAWNVIDYEFPGTEMTAGKTIKATWWDGGKKPPVNASPHLPKDYKLPGSGSMLVGEEGTLILPHWAEPQLYPVEKYKNYPRPKLEPINHYHEFVEACLGNIPAAGANFDFAGPLTESVLLGNVASKFPGKVLEWNARKMKFRNSGDANDALRRKYRKGWATKGLSPWWRTL